MKVSELIEQLQAFDGDATVDVSIERGGRYDTSGEEIDELKLVWFAGHDHVQIMVKKEVRLNSDKARYYWT